MPQPAELIDVLLNPTASIAVRDAAATGLGGYDDPAVLNALVQVASDETVPETLRWSVGAAIGEIWDRNAVRDVETYASMTSAARAECVSLLFARADS